MVCSNKLPGRSAPWRRVRAGRRSLGCSRVCRAAMEGTALPEATSAEAAFRELALAGGVEVAEGVVLADGGGRQGRSLLATTTKPKGTVLLTIPHERTLFVARDAASGASAYLFADPPDAARPALNTALQLHGGDVGALPWDLLTALLLADARNGDGGEWWERYALALLPGREELCHPFLLEDDMLTELQDDDIAGAARAQQERLAGLFPGDVFEWVPWAFACVRSRAFALADDAFAFVPYLDLVNHSEDPNCVFVQPESIGNPIRLAARRDVEPGEEITISYYYGNERYTTRRMLAQYGYVPDGGNPMDRLPLEVPSEEHKLSLEELEDAIPAAMWADAITGRDLGLFAALQSVPIREGSATPKSLEGLRLLLQQVDTAVAAYSTTMAQDEALLAAGTGSPQLDECVRYRLEAKKLWDKARFVLECYAAKLGIEA